MVHITKAHQNKWFTPGRSVPIDSIVIHHWDDPAKNPQFDSTVSYIRNVSGISIHYVVEDGRITEMVDPKNTAWHAGNWPTNQRSIGIECNPRASEGDKRTVGQLIAHLQSRYGKLRIIGHKDVYGTQCPGRYYPPAQVLAPYINGGVSSSPAPSGGKSVAQVAAEVIAGKWGNGTDRVARLSRAGHNPSAVQAEVNRQLAARSTPKGRVFNTVTELARDVIDGNWGNGEDRKRRLTAAGYHYATIQAEVDRLLSGKASTPNNLLPIPVVAAQVIRGDWGNGEDRKRRLTAAGYHYATIQAEVNRQLKVGR